MPIAVRGMARGRAAVAFALLVTAGCAIAPRPAPDAGMLWVTDHGGPARADVTLKAEAVAQRLTSKGQEPKLRVMVAATECPGAWSWPDGTIVLTQRLVEALADDEITAVLAHEVGHHERGNDGAPVSLASGSGGMAAEQAADRAGAAFLTVRELDPVAMQRMLRHVAELVGPETAASCAALCRARCLESGKSSDCARGTGACCSR